MRALDLYTDNERLGLAAYWANDAATKLADGLQVLAENLGALTLPFPPPVVPAPRGRHLRVVK